MTITTCWDRGCSLSWIIQITYLVARSTSLMAQLSSSYSLVPQTRDPEGGPWWSFKSEIKKYLHLEKFLFFQFIEIFSIKCYYKTSSWKSNWSIKILIRLRAHLIDFTNYRWIFPNDCVCSKVKYLSFLPDQATDKPHESRDKSHEGMILLRWGWAE